MIDRGSANARRFMAKDANLTEIETDGSPMGLPLLIDTKLIFVRRAELSAQRVRRRQLSRKGKMPDDLLNNTTCTLLRR
jgi:hypothetical protein